MDKKMLFIYNPHAGKAAIRSNLLDIIDIFAKAEYEVTAYPTRPGKEVMQSVPHLKKPENMILLYAAAETERWMKWWKA